MNTALEKQLAVLAAHSVDLVSRDELRRKLACAAAAKRPLRVKYGADPSAPDMHLGHVVGLNKLRQFQEFGHTVVFIIGDFTGMIGDPSGRSETRRPMTPEQISANAQTYREQVFKVLDPARTEIRFNSEWCAPLSFADVLRLSAHVTVAQMLARDDFQKRFRDNQPISLVEFLYPVIQGYDSVKVQADVEIGGTDQLFNLLVGRDLQKAFGVEQQVVLTLPLLEGLDGSRKMSKSLGNYVGIAEPPREMFGKMMSLPDELMGRYFMLLTGRTEEEIRGWEQEMAHGKRHPRQLKDELACAVVARFHGREAASAASAEFARVFSANQLPDNIPSVIIPEGERENGKIWIVALLVRSGLAESNGAARRLIQQGAVKFAGQKITDCSVALPPQEGDVLQVGKRGFIRIVSR